ncbi:MAG: SMC-Scp complex subunit ScpB [Deltaproteobacteria bacterium]|nr:SMC-Scp complex subunit ScpB [Deltaproteobacteria bacterium]
MTQPRRGRKKSAVEQPTVGEPATPPDATTVGEGEPALDSTAGEGEPERSEGESSRSRSMNGGPGSPTAALRAELGDEPSADPDPAAASVAPPSKGPSPARVEYDDATLTRHVEALLFVSQHPLTVAQVARPLRTTFAAVRRAFQTLGEAYAQRGVRLMDVGGGYQFRTAPECADAIRRFLDVRPLRLSKAAMETLAVVAYRQPVTKPEVDEIRGVDSGSAVKLLLDRNLVRVLGRKEEPGRPLLYGTTQAFLEFFNLPNLNDLPSLREYAELTEDGRRQLERDLFARSPDALSLDGEDGRLRPPRHWEDLVEVLGDDLGGLPEGVEVEVEPSDPLEAYVKDDTFPRSAVTDEERGLDEPAPPNDDPGLEVEAADGEVAAGADDEGRGDDGAEDDVPDDDDDRP